jgi:hypothetical protein
LFFFLVVVVLARSLRFVFVFVSSSRIIIIVTVTTPAANWSGRIDYSNPSFSLRGFDEEDKDEDEGDEEGRRVQFSALLLLLFLLLERQHEQQTLVRGHRIRFGPTGNLRTILPRDAEHPRGRGEQSIGETRSGFYNHRAGVLL